MVRELSLDLGVQSRPASGRAPPFYNIKPSLAGPVQGKAMSREGDVSLVDQSNSCKDASPLGESDSDDGSQDRADRTRTVARSTLRILDTEINSARGSARTLLKVKPANFYALPLDATMVEDDLNPLATIQFFVEVYCPSMLRYPTFRLESRDSVFLDTNLPVMMQDPLITATSLAFALRIRDKRLSRKAVGYYRKALVLLRKRLQSNDATSTDAILLSLIHLMAVEALSEDLGSPLQHIGAMRRMIQIRGELGSSGLQGYIKAHIRSWEMFLGGVYAEPDPDQVRMFPYGSLDYPTHPFDPELSLILSRLPLGLIELAMSCRLSIQVIRVVQTGALLISYLRQKHDLKHEDRIHSPHSLRSDPVSPAQLMFLAIAILQNQDRNMVEELLAISLLALTISTEGLGEHITTGYGFIQTYCMGIWDVDIERECRCTGALGLEDFLLWTKMLLLATFDHDTQTRRTAVQLRRDIPFPDFKPSHFEVCRQFFWTESLGLSLEQKMAQEKALRKPEGSDERTSPQNN